MVIHFTTTVVHDKSQKANKNMQKRSLASSQNNEASKVYHFAIKKYITQRNQVKIESHLTCISHTVYLNS